MLSTKEKLRGSDYRLCCVVLALHLGSNCRLTIRRLLNTLAELCELLYAPADKRTPKFILRLHNVAFSHVIAVRKVIQIPQVLTYRKMFGIYYHSITCHAPFTSRLISLSSVDTEEEEREFSTINSISKSTSNGHPEHIIPNSIIKVQAESRFRSKKSAFVDQQSKIGKFANNLPDFPYTIISDELLATELYQVHLEQISDFLLCGRGVWWHANEESKEIIFHDSKGQPEFRAQGPPMHHFRSSSLHRAKSRVSVILKRGGNMQLHVSVMFTLCGNVKNSSLRDSVTFPERKCQVTFPSYLSHQISAVVRFRHVSANGFAVVCYIYQNINARWFFEQQHLNQ